MRPWIIAFALLGACTPEQKKPSTEQHRAPEPIPSDFEVNSFFGNNPTDLKVKEDGGPAALPLEAGAAGSPDAAQEGDATAATAAVPDEATEPAGTAGDIKLLEPGDEPRAVRKYELKPGRADQLAITLSATLQQQMPGAPAQTVAQPSQVFSVAFLAQSVDAASGDTAIKVTFTKADLVPGAEVDPQQAKQAAQVFRLIAGQSAAMRIHSNGAVAGFSLSNERLARSEIGQIAQQPLEGVLVSFPRETIGRGARWQQVSVVQQEGLTMTTTTTYTLKEVGADLLVTATVAGRVPTRPHPDPRARPGTTFAVEKTGTQTVKLRLDRMPSKGTNESSTVVTIVEPGPGGRGQAVTQKITSKQSFEAAGS
jgi:hypothetical protein